MLDVFKNITKQEMEVISKIADRAHPYFVAAGSIRDKISIEMDIAAAHSNCKLNLKQLLEAPEFDFKHDIFGINRHLDRRTGKLLQCFLPRTARNDRISSDKQELLQDIESTIDHLNNPDAPEPEDSPEEMEEFQQKLIELSKIHTKLKMLGY